MLRGDAHALLSSLTALTTTAGLLLCTLLTTAGQLALEVLVTLTTPTLLQLADRAMLTIVLSARAIRVSGVVRAMCIVFSTNERVAVMYTVS